MADPRIRLVSDGTAPGTQVLLDGKPIGAPITGIDVRIRPNAFAEATITFVDVETDVVAEMESV